VCRSSPLATRWPSRSCTSLLRDRKFRQSIVGLRLDDLDENVIVDVAAEEHFLQLGVDVERLEHLLV